MLISRLTGDLATVVRANVRLKYSCLQGSPKWNHVHLYLPGFTDSNQRGNLISVKFKITLPSSLMEHSSSNQEVPGTCHSGSPPNRTFKCHKDKGSAISRWVREMKARVTDGRRPARPGQGSTVSGGGGAVVRVVQRGPGCPHHPISTPGPRLFLSGGHPGNCVSWRPAERPRPLQGTLTPPPGGVHHHLDTLPGAARV